MKAILLSVKPQYVKRILDGSKKFEYRRVLPRVSCDVLLLYCTSPIKKVVASAGIVRILSDTPASLWERTKRYSGITYRDFTDYFRGALKAYAYELGDIEVFDRPKSLAELGLKTAPQSFMYIDL